MRAMWTQKMLLMSAGLAVVLIPAVVLLLPQPAGGTDVLMTRLPASSKFGCANCHATATPVQGNSDLNAFGNDFLANNSVWNATLATMNSDGDRCSNGFELGDRDGDGVYDYGGTVEESSNPGVADCTLPIDEKTWGVIKDIFRKEMLEHSALERTSEHTFALHFP